MTANEAIEALEKIKSEDGHETIGKIIDVLTAYIAGTVPPSQKVEPKGKR